MKTNKPLVVNLFGVPGAGKSTGAAYIFSKLKMEGVNCELVTEYAKDKVWEENEEVFKNQAYIFGKQSYRLSRCADKVEAIITDSPLPLSIFYNNNKEVYGKNFEGMVMDVFKSYENCVYLLDRVKPYNPVGRHETEEESNAKAEPLEEMLRGLRIPFRKEPGNIEGYENIIKDVLVMLGK